MPCNWRGGLPFGQHFGSQRLWPILPSGGRIGARNSNFFWGTLFSRKLYSNCSGVQGGLSNKTGSSAGSTGANEARSWLLGEWLRLQSSFKFEVSSWDLQVWGMRQPSVRNPLEEHPHRWRRRHWRCLLVELGGTSSTNYEHVWWRPASVSLESYRTIFFCLPDMFRRTSPKFYEVKSLVSRISDHIWWFIVSIQLF